MELNDSTRSPLGIDLNEIPLTPSGDTTRTGICGGCGRPVPEEEKSEEDVVVCDACERGYHLSCSGLDQADCSIDWICSQCVKTGVKSRRWPLGKKQRILDINSSPPSDVDVDVDAVTVTEDSIRSRFVFFLLGNDCLSLALFCFRCFKTLDVGCLGVEMIYFRFMIILRFRERILWFVQ